MSDADRAYPTSDEINALPDHVRGYIHDLETRADPAGDVRRLRLAEDENRMLRAAIAQLEAELTDERDTTSRRISSAEGLRFIAERALSEEKRAHTATKATLADVEAHEYLADGFPPFPGVNNMSDEALLEELGHYDPEIDVTPEQRAEAYRRELRGEEVK